MSAYIATSALAGFNRSLDVRNRLIHTESVGLYHAVRQLIDPVPEIAPRTLDALHLAHARRCGAHEFATAGRNQAEAAPALGFNTLIFY